MMKRIDFLSPQFSSRDISEAVKVLESGWLTAWNPIVKEVEASLAAFVGAKEGVVMSSGTAALHSALLALGIGKGDEVITTPLSWVASSNVILYVGAKPVFVDIDPLTGLIDLNKIEAAITKKTKAIIPVHLYGQMVDMKALSKIAKKHSLLIVEDACHAIEAERGGVKPGMLSDIACFSFHAAKNITAGEGGGAVTNNPEIARLMRSIADSGVEKGGGKRPMVRLGYKYSITAFQVALLKHQLKRISSIRKGREKVFNNYKKFLKKYSLPNIRLPKEIEGTNAYHIFAVLVPAERRDSIREELSKSGIVTDVHFNPIHLEPYYQKLFRKKRGSYPYAEGFGYSQISLPSYPHISLKDQERVIQELARIAS